MVEAEVKNSNNFYRPVILRSDEADVLEVMGNDVRYLLLEQGQTKKYYWIVKAQSSLDKDYRYRAPISVNDAKTSYSVTSLEVRYDHPAYSLSEIEDELFSLRQEDVKVYSKEFNMFCNAPGFIYGDQTAEIECELSNKGNLNLNGLKVCFENSCNTIDLKINQDYSLAFDFAPRNYGKQELKVEASNNDVFKRVLMNMNVLEVPELSIDVIAPEKVAYEDEFNVIFNMSINSEFENMTLSLFDNGEEMNKWQVDELRIFELRLLGMNLFKGQNNFELKAEYSDLSGRKYEKTSQFTIELEKLSFWQSLKYFFAHMFG
ncbi:hypothetical protein KY316_01545 [Candidatus Woesearchaeota archaeon]|nr:hypothetical protein [Candidatus Woesearchaeota archaeon]